jgi:NAD(P)H-dependent FMN reductase
MSADRLNVAVIVGSVRAGRFGPTVATWFAGNVAARDDMTLDLIDLADFTHPADMSDADDVRAFAARIGAADAFVVVTPEYNHSYPGPLKTALDSLGQEWRGKVAGFVSYGGLSGGLRAVEALRVVFAELHVATIRETVSFHGVRGQFDAEGNPVHAEAVGTAAIVMLNQLAWWARALKEARASHPYGS